MHKENNSKFPDSMTEFKQKFQQKLKINRSAIHYYQEFHIYYVHIHKRYLINQKNVIFCIWGFR